MRISVEDLFTHETRGHVVINQNIQYDVRITGKLDNTRSNQQVRFAFAGKAYDVLRDVEYIEVSNIQKCKTRIYFMPAFEKKKGARQTHKLLHSTSDAKSHWSCYTCITPTKSEKEEYVSWIGGRYMINIDEENRLYYIEKTKEAK